MQSAHKAVWPPNDRQPFRVHNDIGLPATLSLYQEPCVLGY